MATTSQPSGWRPVVLLGLSSLLMFAGCKGNDPGHSFANMVNSGATENADKVKDVEKAQEQLFEKQKALEAKTDQQIQKAAEHIVGAACVNASNRTPDRYTLLAGKELAAAEAALGPLSDEYRARIAQNQISALGASPVDFNTVIANYQGSVQQAENTRAERDAARKDVNAARENLATKTSQLKETSGKLASVAEQTKRAAALADDKARREDEKKASEARLWMARLCMLGGVLLMGGAVVATALRVPGVLVVGLVGGAGLFALGWFMTVLQQWLHNLGFQILLGVGLFGVLAAAVVLGIRMFTTRTKGQRDEKIAMRVIGAVQEARNDDERYGTGVYAALKPYLKEWFVDDDGEDDVSMKKEINRRLVAMNLKNPPGTENFVKKFRDDGGGNSAGSTIRKPPKRNGPNSVRASKAG